MLFCQVFQNIQSVVKEAFRILNQYQSTGLMIIYENEGIRYKGRWFFKSIMVSQVKINKLVMVKLDNNEQSNRHT